MSTRLIPLLSLLAVFALPVQAQAPEVLAGARAALAEGDYGRVVAQLQGAPDLTADGHRLLGFGLQALQQHAAAVDALTRADTTDARVLAALGRSYDRLGYPDEAEAAYRQAYARDSLDTNVATALARLYADRDRWKPVQEIYAHLVAADPDNSFLRTQLGTAYTALDAVTDASAHFERALILDPRNVQAALKLSGVYLGRDYVESAERILHRALDERPRNARLWQRYGEAMLKKPDYDEAVLAFRSALQYGDSTALALRSYGAALYLQGAVGESVEPLLAAHAADTLDGMTTFYLGMAYQALADYEASLRYLDRTADLMGRDLLSDVYRQRGATLDQAERDADALRAYRLAHTLAPEKGELLFHLAALYDELYADPSTALDHYERFLAAVPEDKMPRLRTYAEQRISEIRERQFFDAGRAGGDDASADSAAIRPAAPDTAGADG